MVNNLYVLGKGLISASGHSGDPDFWIDPRIPDTYPWTAREPSYEGMIHAHQLRRLTKVVRMGIGAARMALDEAGLPRPDMISTGTAMGCFHETEEFLDQMVRFDEGKLSPTPFMQSTHNTVGGQIALATGCLGQNLCFAQGGHSFELTLMDAQLWLQTYPSGKALVGGMEEMTSLTLEKYVRKGIYRAEGGDPLPLMETRGGSLAAEGAGFFLISDAPGASSPLLKVEGLEIFTAADADQAIEKWEKIRQSGSWELPDLVLTGQDGHPAAYPFYRYLQDSGLQGRPTYPFKRITGTFETVSALALGMACQLGEGRCRFPDFPLDPPKVPRRLWIINHHMEDYSFWNLRLYPR